MFSDLIKELGQHTGAGSKARKLDVLKAWSDIEGIKTFLSAVCDPSIVYHISKYSLPEEHGDKILDKQTIQEFVDTLYGRKKTGNDAIEYVNDLCTTLTPDEQKLINLIFNRNLGVGVGVALINEVFEDLIHIESYSRCQNASKKNLGKANLEKGFYSQIKMDGKFGNHKVYEDRPTIMTSRYGIPWPRITQYIMDRVDGFAEGKVYTGELTVWDNLNNEILVREDGNGKLMKFEYGDDTGFVPDENGHTRYTINFTIWDMIDIKCWEAGLDKTPYKERYENMVKLPINERESIISFPTNNIVRSIEDAAIYFTHAVEDGEEGTVLKDPDGPWKHNTSTGTPYQIKFKIIAESEVMITGFEEGKGKYEGTVGSIMYESSDGLVSGTCSGITDKMRKAMNDNREYFKGQIFTARYNNILQSDEGTYTLYLPRFVEIRNDKDMADDLKHIFEDFENAKQFKV